METMKDLFLHLLMDVHDAENQILKALPKMIKAAEAPELKRALEQHQHETESQIKRLDQIFEQLHMPARDETCEAIMGIISEGNDVIKKGRSSQVVDAGVAATALAIEHYEIARYSTLIRWAKQLGLPHAVALLKQTLEEEKAGDKKLTELART
jgi:ferritin-like metal-binding protein YciE